MSTDIAGLLDRAASASPDAPAILTADETISYADLRRRVELEAAQYSRVNERCAVVAVESHHTIDVIVTMLALFRAGLVVLPLNMRYPAATRTEQARRLADFMLTKSGRLTPIESGRPIGTIGQLLNGVDAPAVVILTSGSSGEPKGVVLTHDNLIASAEGVSAAMEYRTGDCWLNCLPLWHVGGLGILIRSLLVGGTMLLAESSNLVQMFSVHTPTHLSLVDAQLERLLELPSLCPQLRACRGILMGGSAISPARLQRAKELGFPVVLSYGLTEMSSTVTLGGNRAVSSVASPFSSGRLLPGREIRLTPDGEIEVRGRTRFAGYLHDRNLVRPFTDGGWFATGDLGHLSSDGELTVTGRKDWRFKSGGEQVQPELIERHLLADPRIRAVIVLPADDGRFGYRPVAIVSLAGELALDAVSPELEAQLREKLPGYLIPIRWYRWPDVAVGSSGMKPDRTRLGQWLRSQLSPAE